MVNIEYGKLDDLSSFEVIKLRKLAEKNLSKIEHYFDNPVFILNVKQQRKAGKRSLFDIKIRVNDPDLKFTASQQDWDFNTALHKTFDNLTNSVNHKMKKNATPIIKKVFMVFKRK